MFILKYIKMKKMKFLLVVFVGMAIVSCTNEVEEVMQSQDLQTRSIEPKFTSDNLTESQGMALMNKFLDAPYFFILRM